MIYLLIALILGYLAWCLEGGHEAIIRIRIEVGLIAAASCCATIGVVQIVRQIV